MKGRDPQMHQTRKGQQGYFGMSAHLGVGAHSSLVHTLIGTAAHVSDISQAEHLLHGQEGYVVADAGYVRVHRRDGLQGRPINGWIARRRSQIRALPEGPRKRLWNRIETLKARTRARVELPFHVIKNRFGHRKVRYRGLAKNTAPLFSLFGLANRVIAKRWLGNAGSHGAS